MKTSISSRVLALVASSLFGGCDKGSDSKPAAQNPSRADAPALSQGEPLTNPKPSSLFPETPHAPKAFTQAPEFTGLDESELIRTFESASGEDWSRALKEMATRKTPECLRVMAANIMLAKGICVLSGEYIYSPAHASPVAIALSQCGDDARPALIEAAKNLNLDQKSRVLNVWVLMGLNAKESASLDWFNLDSNHDSVRQSLTEVIEITSDKNRLTALFPQDAPKIEKPF